MGGAPHPHFEHLSKSFRPEPRDYSSCYQAIQVEEMSESGDGGVLRGPQVINLYPEQLGERRCSTDPMYTCLRAGREWPTASGGHGQ